MTIRYCGATVSDWFLTCSSATGVSSGCGWGGCCGCGCTWGRFWPLCLRPGKNLFQLSSPPSCEQRKCRNNKTMFTKRNTPLQSNDSLPQLIWSSLLQQRVCSKHSPFPSSFYEKDEGSKRHTASRKAICLIDNGLKGKPAIIIIQNNKLLP